MMLEERIGFMKTRIGKVVRVEGEGVMVRFERPTSCTGCGACARDQKTTTVFALGKASVGDIAQIQMPEGKIKRPAYLNYLVPAFGFICGLSLAYVIRPTELVMVLGAICGMVLGSVMLRLFDSRLVKQAGGQAQVVAVNEPQVLEMYRKLSTCPKATAWKGVV